MDYSLYKTINGLSGSSFDGVMRLCANDLPGVLVAIVALAFLIPGGADVGRRRCGAVLATASAGLALLIARSHDPSFPSDHAVGGFALAMGIWLYDKTIGTVMLVLAALLAFARVYVGTHYPGDVVAGALLGGVVTLALYFTPARRLLEAVAARAAHVWDAVLGRVFRRTRTA